MITAVPPTTAPPAVREAWINSLSHDDSTIVYAPIGWRWSLAMAAELKRVLLQEKSPQAQEKLLGELQGLTGSGVTEAAIACVQPFCERGAALLGATGGNLDAIGSLQVFSSLVDCNRSLLDAIRKCGHGREEGQHS